MGVWSVIRIGGWQLPSIPPKLPPPLKPWTSSEKMKGGGNECEDIFCLYVIVFICILSNVDFSRGGNLHSLAPPPVDAHASNTQNPPSHNPIAPPLLPRHSKEVYATVDFFGQ